jgi:hypothetical protein
MPSRTRKNRKSPSESATLFAEGTIKFAGKRERWVVSATKQGVKRWIPFHSGTLFGYKPLTAKILSKHINKPIDVFERASLDKWPSEPSDFDVRYTFTASGDAVRDNKIFKNWLKTKKPAVRNDDLFLISGEMKSKDLNVSIQVAPEPGELISTNLMNTDAFVKI